MSSEYKREHWSFQIVARCEYAIKSEPAQTNSTFTAGVLNCHIMKTVWLMAVN